MSIIARASALMDSEKRYRVVNGRRFLIIDTRVCGCGCGQSYDVSTANRTQRYINDAHMRVGNKPAVMGTRICECGCNESFTVTARRPTQRFIDNTHRRPTIPPGLRASVEARHRVTQERYENVVDEFLSRERITRSSLVELVARAARMGYQSAKNQQYRGAGQEQDAGHSQEVAS